MSAKRSTSTIPREQAVDVHLVRPDERPLWLGRYHEPLPVRSRGAFHMLSVAREGSAVRSLVIVGARGTDALKVGQALDAIAHTHRLLDLPRVAPVVERGEHAGIPFLELQCDAVIEGHEILRLLGDAGTKMSYAHGDTLFSLLRETLQAAHQVVDPATGRPVCLGQVSYGNFVFSRTGQMWVVGLGFNFPVLRENGLPDGLSAAFQAPEVLAGEPATPIADYVAVLIAARSLTSFCDISEITRRVLSAAVSSHNVELYETVRFFESRFVAEPPASRPPIEVGIAKSMRLREILGTRLDPEGLTRTIVNLLEVRPLAEEAGRVTIAADGSTIVLASGTRHTLGRAHRQILRLLLQSHRASPERRLDVWELLEAGWPGEDPIPEAGANRVYVAIAHLRQQGLRAVIEQKAGGYRLRPGNAFRIAGIFG